MIKEIVCKLLSQKYNYLLFLQGVSFDKMYFVFDLNIMVMIKEIVYKLLSQKYNYLLFLQGVSFDFSRNTFFPDFQTMHSLMYSSLRIFRRMLMLQLGLFESDLKVVQGDCAN